MSESTKSSDDVVFAISFSPDGRTLAIARGASEWVKRFGRIELWDVESLKLRVLIKGFDGPVRSLSFSADGATLISGSTEFRSLKLQQKARSREGVSSAELKWWDTRTGDLKRKLTIPNEDIYSVRAIQSPDDRQLVLSEYSWLPAPLDVAPIFRRPFPFDRDVMAVQGSYWSRAFFKVEMKVVDAQTGELKFKLSMKQPGASSLSPDGYLLAAANGNEVKLWNLQTGKEQGKLKGFKGVANAVAFSPDGRTVAVVSTKFEREYADSVIKIIGISEVQLFEVSTGKVLLDFNNVGAVNAVAFSPDGRILIAGGLLSEKNGGGAGLNFFNLETSKRQYFPTGADYKESVGSLTTSRDGNLLAFQSGSGSVKLLDTRKGAVKQTWDAESAGDAVERRTSRYVVSLTRVLAVSFSADDKLVSAENDQGEIRSWDPRTGEIKRRLGGAEDDPSLVALSADGKSFAEVSQGKLLLWNPNGETKTVVTLPVQLPVSALTLGADGQLLAIGCGRDVVLLSPRGDVVKNLSRQEGLVKQLAFSSDQRLLAGVDQSGVMKIWNVASGRIETTFNVGSVTALVFGPNGQTLATATQDNAVSIWNVQTGALQAKLRKHESTVNALAFSPNGQWLASGSDDRTIVLWEAATGKSKRTFKGHEQTVSSLAFSSDGRLLASGSGNASVVLWEVETGKLNRILE